MIGILGSVYYFGYYKPLRAELIEKARQLEEIDSRMYYNPNGENRSEESIKAIEEELIDRKFGSRMNLIFEKHNSEWYIVKEDIKPIV